jgi:hypothetical protein
VGSGVGAGSERNIFGSTTLDRILKGQFLDSFSTMLNTASYVGPQIPQCWRMLGSNPGLLRLWQSERILKRPQYLLLY